VHSVAAAKAHEIRHPGAVEVRAARLRVFAHVDIRFHNVALVVDIIAELARDMIFVLLKHGVAARRRGEPFLAGRDG